MTVQMPEIRGEAAALPEMACSVMVEVMMAVVRRDPENV